MMDRCDGPACDMARRLREVGLVAQELHRDNALLIARLELLQADARGWARELDAMCNERERHALKNKIREAVGV